MLADMRRAAVLAGCLVAIAIAPGTAAAFSPQIGPPVPALDHLKDTAVSLLDAHLHPGVTVPIYIGYMTNTAPGKQSPAYTNSGTHTYPTRKPPFNKEVYCQIAVNKPTFDADTMGNSTWEEEVVTHEVFHCYEFQLEGADDAKVTYNEPWVQEGLARWVDMDLFHPPIAESVGSLQQYFDSSGTSLLDRSYDSVGFWGHLEDVSGDVWHRIPSILRAATDGSQDAVDAALKGVDQNDFFDTWGSSALNDPAGGNPWTARNPTASLSMTAPTEVISPAGPNQAIPVKLAPYSTGQLYIDMPAAPPGSVETLRVDLGVGYGRFGLHENYTGSGIEGKTFCGGPSGCSPGKTMPPSGGCGSGSVAIPPPPLTPMPSDPVLGVAAAKGAAVITLEYAAVPVTEAITSTCQPSPHTTPPGSGSGSAASGGDPHLIDFDGFLFNFQAAGEFTLLKSTKDNLQIQERQQPFPHSKTVAVNTAVAMQVGKAVVEIDSAGKSGVSALVNHKRFRGTHTDLKGGGSLSIIHTGGANPGVSNPKVACEAVLPPGATLKLCEMIIQGMLEGSTTATVRWSDGTTVSVRNSLTGTSLKSWAPSIGLQIKVAKKRLKHLTGLLGNADVPYGKEFQDRDGHPVSTVDVLDGDIGTPAEAYVLYDQFGASWRITQKQSLFTYGRHKSTRSYTIANFPQPGFSVAQAPPTKQMQAGQLCHAAGNKNPLVLKQCEYDVVATGNPAFAGGEAPLEAAGTSYPTPPPHPCPRSTLAAAPTRRCSHTTRAPGRATSRGSTTAALRSTCARSPSERLTATEATAPTSSSTRSPPPAPTSTSRWSCSRADRLSWSQRSTVGTVRPDSAATASSCGLRPPAGPRSLCRVRGSPTAGSCWPVAAAVPGTFRRAAWCHSTVVTSGYTGTATRSGAASPTSA